MSSKPLYSQNQWALAWVLEKLEKAQVDNAFAEIHIKVKCGMADDCYYTDQQKASLRVKVR